MGSLELDPSIRKGGDSGLPVAVAGPESEIAKGFYEIARKVARSAMEIAGRTQDVLEIS